MLIFMGILPRAPTLRSEPSGRFGLGMLTVESASSIPAAQTVNLDTMAPGGLATTTDHRLVVNRALRAVIEYFLLGGHPGEQATHLTNLFVHLQSKLPLPASHEAVQIAQNYLTYLQEHDKLLAHESMPASGCDTIILTMDIDRISAWTAQRAWLRQSVFGIGVAQIWFGQEEAETRLQIEEMRKRSTDMPRPGTADINPLQQGSDQLRAMRANSVSLDTQREYVLAQFGPQAAQRFDAPEQEEQVLGLPSRRGKDSAAHQHCAERSHPANR